MIYKNGSVGKIGVRKEVILCTGSVNTPQLLLISGIGPISELEKHKVNDKLARDRPRDVYFYFNHIYGTYTVGPIF